jgi:hypothetical protein
MTKTRKTYHKKKQHKSNLFRNIRKTTAKAIPVVASGLKNVGSTVQNVAVKSAPVVEKGIGSVYGTLASGFDLGIKGVKKGLSMVTARGTKNRCHRKKKHSSSRKK